MPNNNRTQLDATWVDGYVVPQADWEDLDRKVFEALNGDRGGAYMAIPTASDGIIIGGSGLQVTGKLKLSQALVTVSGTSRFKIPDGTWPKFKTPRPRVIPTTIDSVLSEHPHLWARPADGLGIGSVALSCRETGKPTIERPEMVFPIRVHDGATITAVTFYFRVATDREKPPKRMPRFRVFRTALGMGMHPRDRVYLKSTTDGDGFASPPDVRSGSAWYADGKIQSFTYTCDQNNVIDKSQYGYFAHIVEEHGADTFRDPFDGLLVVERKADVGLVQHNNIYGTLPITTDGLPVGSGERLLCVSNEGLGATRNQYVGFAHPLNGIYIASAANPYARAADLDEAADFTPNFIVRATRGQREAGAVWQLDSPNNRTGATIDLTMGIDGPAIYIRPAQVGGNVYVCAEAAFEVSDLRFQ